MISTHEAAADFFSDLSAAQTQHRYCVLDTPELGELPAEQLHLGCSVILSNKKAREKQFSARGSCLLLTRFHQKMKWDHAHVSCFFHGVHCAY